MGCTVFIDESGDAGIEKVRSDGQLGASPYFVMAAAVMPRATKIHAAKVLSAVTSDIQRRWKHATDLNHSQTVFFCRKSVAINLRFFAIVSKKATLGDYASDISWDPDKFYNKCAQYLLECVGEYLHGKRMFEDDPDVVFESRNHDFDKLRRYIGKIKDNPIHARARFLQCFNPFGFVERAKDEEPLLKFSDLAAHSVYQCVNKIRSNHYIPEPRYIQELQSRFGADEKGRVLGVGLKCIHSPDQLGLDDDILKAWERLRAKPRIPVSL